MNSKGNPIPLRVRWLKEGVEGVSVYLWLAAHLFLSWVWWLSRNEWCSDTAEQHKTFLFKCGKWISAEGKLASPESHISICLPQIKSSSLKEAELSACCLLPPIHQSALS